ncbi:hypothetical protein ON010_g4573 [Phytophthora cinnamomi]|nr:hypothetical protein ON010_g4573 [Phytophthora cinnamomi]
MNDYCVKRKRVKMGTGDEGDYGGHVWLQPTVLQYAVVGTEVSRKDLSDSSDTDLSKHLDIDRQREVNCIRQQRYRARKYHRIQTIGATNIHVNAAGMHTVMEEKVVDGCATVGRGIGGQDQQQRNRHRKQQQRSRDRQQLREGVAEESFEIELSDNERAEGMRRLQSTLGANSLDECVHRVRSLCGSQRLTKGERHGLELQG